MKASPTVTDRTPFPYQRAGIQWLRSKYFCLLADEMGLGKTPQAILAAEDMRRILVVCPAAAKVNWAREFRMWAGREAFIVGHYQKNQTASDVVVTNYRRCVEDIQKRGELSPYLSTAWDLVIFDESHYIKEPNSQRTQALFNNGGLIHSTKRAWCLTGTPAPNHAGELWVWLKTFGYTALTYEGFVTRYCNVIPDPRHYSRKKVTGTSMKPERIAELRSMMKPAVLRRKKADVLKDLPKLRFETRLVDSCRLEKAVEADMREKLQQEWLLLSEKLGMDWRLANDENLLNVLTLFAQSFPSLARYHGLKKVGSAVDILRTELTDGAYQKIVLFATHSDVIQQVAIALKQFGVVQLTGKTTPRGKQDAIDRFQNDPATRVFIGNIKAAGTAITLTAAHHVTFLERSTVPADNAQAADRVNRIGQKFPVSARFFCLPGFDERVTQIVERKIREISAFMD